MVARVAITLGLVSLVVVSAILFAAGAAKNAQIDDLRARGVPVTVTVTRCLGLLGGSGSNAAGYACRGTYRFDGRRYNQAIPGDVNRAPGSVLRVIVDPDDPALLSTVPELHSEHSSGRVFIAPSVLLAVALGVGGLLLVRRRRAAPSLADPGRVGDPEART